MINFRAGWLMAATVLLGGLPCRADLLLGTSMTATVGLTAIPSVSNWYTTPTSLVATVDTIFTAPLPPINTITADLSVTSAGDFLTLSVLVDAGQSGMGWNQTFQDAALVNFTMAEVSSTFPGLAPISFAPKTTGTNTLSFSWAGSGVVSSNTTYTAVFSLTDPPFTPVSTAQEPSSAMPLLAALGVIGYLSIKRRRPGAGAVFHL